MSQYKNSVEMSQTGDLNKVEEIELKDGSPATIFYLSHEEVEDIPLDIRNQILELYNEVIDEGKTYPFYERATKESIKEKWFLHHFAILVAGHHHSKLSTDLEVLGTYYVKPNYPGRCSHVSNAGFLVSTRHRGQGIGKVLGHSYLRWAPTLGYTYSVFNLVFATNVASWKIWEALGFSRIGTVPGAAVLEGFSDPVDAYIYGKALV